MLRPQIEWLLCTLLGSPIWWVAVWKKPKFFNRQPTMNRHRALVALHQEHSTTLGSVQAYETRDNAFVAEFETMIGDRGRVA